MTLLLLFSCVWLYCDLMDCSPPGSSVHGISQARILEWVTISFSRGSSKSRDQTHISCIGKYILYHWATRDPPTYDITVERLPKLRNQHWYITINYILDFIWMSSVSPLRSFFKKNFNFGECHIAYGILVLRPGIEPSTQVIYLPQNPKQVATWHSIMPPLSFLL